MQSPLVARHVFQLHGLGGDDDVEMPQAPWRHVLLVSSAGYAKRRMHGFDRYSLIWRNTLTIGFYERTDRACDENPL